MRYGMLAGFSSPDECADAIRKLRELGFAKLDAYVPYPEKSIQEALEVKRSPLPWLCFGAGLSGAGIAYLIMWWTNAVDYPIDVAGHPSHAVPAFIPITFETMILFAGCTAFAAGLLLGGLPRLYHPLFAVPELRRITIDRFYAAVDGSDPSYDPEALRQVFHDLGSEAIVDLGAVHEALEAAEKKR